MRFTTPPRRIDIEASYPGIERFARPAVRLHPRLGSPAIHDSVHPEPVVDYPYPGMHPEPLPETVKAGENDESELLELAFHNGTKLGGWRSGPATNTGGPSRAGASSTTTTSDSRSVAATRSTWSSALARSTTRLESRCSKC